MIHIASYTTVAVLVIHLIFYLASAYYSYRTDGSSPAQKTLVKMTGSVLCALTFWITIIHPSLVNIVTPSFMGICMFLSQNAHKSLFDNKDYQIRRDPLLVQVIFVSLVCFVIGLFKSEQTFVINAEVLPEWNARSVSSVAYYVQNIIYTFWLTYLSYYLVRMFYVRITNISDRTIQTRIIGAIIAWSLSVMSIAIMLIDLIISIITNSTLYHPAINTISITLIAATPFAFLLSVIPQKYMEAVTAPISKYIDDKQQSEAQILRELNEILIDITPSISRMPGPNKTTHIIEINDARDMIWTNIPRISKNISPEVEAAFIIYFLRSQTNIRSHGPFPALDPNYATKAHAVRVYNMVRLLNNQMAIQQNERI